MVNNIPVNGWPQLKDLEAVQPILNRLDKIEAWKRTVKEDTFTGEEITIPNALALPARSLITEINALQDLHGYDKPWVGGAGKNLYGGTLSTIFDFPRILATGTVISISLDKTGEGNVTMNLYKANETTRYDFFTLSGTGRVSRTVTLIDDTARVMFYADSGVTAENIQIEVGSSATSFAPYSNICPISGRTAAVITRSDGDEISEDFTIQLGTTVYGADINWDTGVATVLWASKTFSDIDNWNFNTSYHIAYCYVTGKANGYDTIMSDSYKVVNKPYGEMADGEISAVQGQDGMNVKDDRFDNLSDFMTAVGSSQLVYKLATPTTIQLTPTMLEMLKGYNHITLSDGYGTIELKALTGANWS